MKVLKFISRLSLCCATMGILVCLSNCSEDPTEDLPEIPSGQQMDHGFVEFDMDCIDGEGDGTSSSPMQVGNDTTIVVLSQKSRYVETDGSVLECEPKATVKAFSKMDTVYVDDIQKLTQVNEKAVIENFKNGSSPVVKRAKYTFQNGPQSVSFDLVSEYYEIETTLKQKITMPHIQLSYAKFGKSTEVESTDAKRSISKSVPCIALKAARLTKATNAADSTYNVSLLFHVAAESAKTKESIQKTLYFEINYVGVVRNKVVMEEKKSITYETTVNGEKADVSSPISVEGKTTELVINQKSIYSDSEGSVFECKPQALVKVFAEADTVVVSNIADLKAVDYNVDKKTVHQGNNPDVTSMSQSFKIGSQQVIHFDIINEVYSHEGLAGSLIAMPSVELRPALYGSTLDNANGDTPLEASKIVKIDEVKVSRAMVTDSALYQVTVKFNVPFETIHTDSVTKGAFDFEVKYMAIVETKTSIPDTDSGTLIYETLVNGKENDLASPILVGKEKTAVVWKQKSIFEDTKNKTFECSPEASIVLSAELDTVIVSDVNELTQFVPEVKTTTTQQKEKTVTTQSFQIGGQNINCDVSYEAFSYTTNYGQKMVMPHVKLSEAAFGSSKENGTADAVQITQIDMSKSGRSLITNRTYYEVKVRLNSLAECVNLKKTSQSPVVFEVRYIGVVETEIEKPEIVKTEYERSWVWAEAEYNLSLRHINYVTRVRTYSNGDVTREDFPDVGHPAGGAWAWTEPSNRIQQTPTKYIRDEHKNRVDSITYDSYKREITDSTSYVKQVCTVGDLSLLEQEAPEVRLRTYADYGDYQYYLPSYFYNDEICWYATSIVYEGSVRLMYRDLRLIDLGVNTDFHDQYLEIDGRKIEFKDLRPVNEWKMTTEDLPASATHGRGIKIRYECKSTFLGRHFIGVTEGFIYESKK